MFVFDIIMAYVAMHCKSSSEACAVKYNRAMAVFSILAFLDIAVMFLCFQTARPDAFYFLWTIPHIAGLLVYAYRDRFYS